MRFLAFIPDDVPACLELYSPTSVSSSYSRNCSISSSCSEQILCKVQAAHTRILISEIISTSIILSFRNLPFRMPNVCSISCLLLNHFYSLWQEIIFTVVNGLTQNQSLTFSKLKLNKKRKSKRLMRLLKIKCTNMIINGVTYMNLIYSGQLLSTCKKIIYI